MKWNMTVYLDVIGKQNLNEGDRSYAKKSLITHVQKDKRKRWN